MELLKDRRLGRNDIYKGGGVKSRGGDDDGSRSEVARAPTSLHKVGVTEVKKDGVSGTRGGQ